MSVRRTVAQSSAGLLLLAAFAAGPSAVFAAPGEASDGGSDQPPAQTECPTDASGDYIPTLALSTSNPAPGEQVTLTATCLPDRGPIDASVVLPSGDPVAAEGGDTATPGGEQTWTFPVPTEDAGGTYSFMLSMDSWTDNRTFTVVVEDEPTSPPTTPAPDPEKPTDPEPSEPTPGEDDSDPGNDPGADSGQESDPDDGDQGSESGDGDIDNQDTDNHAGGAKGDDEKKQDNGQKNGRNSGDGSQLVDPPEDGEPTASGSPTNSFPGGEEDGDTSASSANASAASTGNASAQPPAAPGSATNDFPAAQQEATADQKQSAALAVLMTKLFAGGVSSGSVGTTPDQARTVIDPSADASEIEVPAGSDTGGSSDNSSGSETSDGDALAATGSNILLPAGIAAAAILLGAGLKIHQLRRGL